MFFSKFAKLPEKKTLPRRGQMAVVVYSRGILITWKRDPGINDEEAPSNLLIINSVSWIKQGPLVGLRSQYRLPPLPALSCQFPPPSFLRLNYSLTSHTLTDKSPFLFSGRYLIHTCFMFPYFHFVTSFCTFTNFIFNFEVPFLIINDDFINYLGY